MDPSSFFFPVRAPAQGSSCPGGPLALHPEAGANALADWIREFYRIFFKMRKSEFRSKIAFSDEAFGPNALFSEKKIDSGKV